MLNIYTETKKFSNTLQIRIFITEIHVEINTEFFIVNLCDYNLTQNQIFHALLPNFIFMERSVCHKMFSKGQNVNILIFLRLHPRMLQTVLVNTHVPETVPRHYAKRVCCKKSLPSIYDLNETFLQWSKFFFCLPDLGRFQANFLCTKQLFIRYATVLWISKWTAT